jgi:VIT1/CCC1 family predicted Fe2+/Mn2+ transporter
VNRAKSSSYVKNFIFGVEDSLVSTVGLLSGIATGGLPKSEIFLTGIVLIFVEAFSMGVGSYLSEGFIEDLNHNRPSGRSTLGGLIMFCSYFLSGFVPLSPYVFLPTQEAMTISILLSLVSLLLLGTLSAYFFKVKPIKHGLRMLLIGGGAITIGILIGKSLNV